MHETSRQSERAHFDQTFSRVLVVLAALGLILGVSLGGAAFASAQPRPEVITPVAWAPNGCTLSPDSAFGVSFKAACDQHDRCYRYRLAGEGIGGFFTCNNRFETDMLRACGGNQACRGQASLYATTVRTVGWPNFVCRACY
ncbi:MULTISPECIES: phospholipase A2 [unclassified Rhodococcus (in: high G+C Gram-positive bacteria)]|uniref:phospholipase A2 n=1 Tax=unclassified Rhodococcus (in: high G+C Gram-positive bacteria) TaxID=192944 RepID=UPI0009E73326